MEQIAIEFLKGFDLQTIISIGIIIWFMNMPIRSSLKKIDVRLEKIEAENKDIRTSLNRMEGAFYSKDCCMLKDDKSNKNVV